MKAGAISLAAFFTLFAIAASARDADECPVPRGFVSVKLPGGLPPALVKIYRGNSYFPGQSSPCCDIPLLRVLFVWNKGMLWVVGGRLEGQVEHDYVDLFQVSRDGRESRSIVPHPHAGLYETCSMATYYADHLTSQ